MRRLLGHRGCHAGPLGHSRTAPSLALAQLLSLSIAPFDVMAEVPIELVGVETAIAIAARDCARRPPSGLRGREGRAPVAMASDVKAERPTKKSEYEIRFAATSVERGWTDGGSLCDDVPTDAFWSVSVYNAAGYFELGTSGITNVNSVFARIDPDGATTVHLGDYEDDLPNCISLPDGWNLLMRLYRPRLDELESWKVPEIVAD